MSDIINKLRTFLWFCAGANIELLKKDECKTEHEKYAGFGATVLFTGIYSGLSGSYALYRVFAFYYISIPGGFLWFLIMFNLNRLFMLSIRNNEEDSSSKDNKEDNSSEINIFLSGCKSVGKKLLFASPQIFLVSLLAFVISKPIEVRIFEKEIDQKVFEKNQDKKNKIDEKYNLILNNLDRQKKELDQDRVDIIPLINNNPLLQSELDNRKKAVDDKEKEIEELKKKRDGEKEELEKKSATTLARLLSILEELAQEKNNNIGNINFVITLLFFTLELSPIILKIFLPYGPYDRLMSMEEEKQKQNHEIEKRVLERRKKFAEHLVERAMKTLEREGKIAEFLAEEGIEALDREKEYVTYSYELEDVKKQIAELNKELEKLTTEKGKVEEELETLKKEKEEAIQLELKTNDAPIDNEQELNIENETQSPNTSQFEVEDTAVNDEFKKPEE